MWKAYLKRRHLLYKASCDHEIRGECASVGCLDCLYRTQALGSALPIDSIHLKIIEYGVRRFLEDTNYLAMFIPNLSRGLEPHTDRQDTGFLWVTEQQAAFKELTTSDQLLDYFDPKKPVESQTDASTIHTLTRPYWTFRDELTAPDVITCKGLKS